MFGRKKRNKSRNNKEWSNKKNQNQKEKRKIPAKSVHGAIAIVGFTLTIIFLMASLGRAGIAGDWLYNTLQNILGAGYFLLPAASAIFSIVIIQEPPTRNMLSIGQSMGIGLFFISGLGILSMIIENGGGLMGSAITNPIISVLDTQASMLVLMAIFIIAIVILFDLELSRLAPSVLKPCKFALCKLGAKIFMRKKNSDQIADDITMVVDSPENLLAQNETLNETLIDQKIMQQGTVSQSPHTQIPQNDSAINVDDDARVGFSLPKFSNFHSYKQPSLALLEGDRGKPSVGDIKANTNIIKRSLANFGITVEMDEVSIGPSITRYALKPAEGVKLARIVGLKNDLALALAAHPIRIEAPIPGKSLVGIEIPNASKATIGLGTLLSFGEFQRSELPLLIALGKSITGKAHFANLAKMPHMLIAGATGSGKSVTIHSVITSLIFRNPPEQLQMILIDPKRVELTLYNGIPHLLTPVITNAKQALLALKWTAKEMDRRYDIFESESVRDIDSYHRNIVMPAYQEAKKKIAKLNSDDETKITSKLPERLPYIVMIIDELADIMQTYPREFEASVVRIAQMSRAVGIHLILSTQRPSVNVITGLIKANIPARVALQVASQVDSRTILDMSGAEALLGAGDMLYTSGEMSKPVRLQSAFISEREVKNVVDFLQKQYEGILPNELLLSSEANGVALPLSFEQDATETNDHDDDALYEDAREIIISAGKASTSLLQRRLRIGYGRAARLIDILEARGVVGPSDGSKARRVLSTNEEQQNNQAQDKETRS